MDKRTMANQLVADFGKMLTLEGLALDAESNSCVLLFDKDLVLNIEYEDSDESLIFSIYIGDLPSEKAEPILRELMGANLYWHQTRGATLCLEAMSNSIILAYPRRVADIDSQQFENIVENLLNQAEKWRATVLDLSDSANAVSIGSPVYSGLFV